ncbi:MAG: Flp family type IVb pilin [Acidobacteria bacterium]|nr:MAG: Flp family type IVb pilin [Acidobacteriota bacterium]
MEASVKSQLSRFLSEESGQDLVEYALLLFLVLAVAIATVKAVGGKVSSVFSGVLSFLT